MLRQYLDIYLSPASPAANSEAAGTGKTWFKVWQWAPTYDASTNSLTFPPSTIDTFNVTIPKSLPSGKSSTSRSFPCYLICLLGQYLIRFEVYTVHSPGST
jgi:hypothetical protein